LRKIGKLGRCIAIARARGGQQVLQPRFNIRPAYVERLPSSGKVLALKNRFRGKSSFPSMALMSWST